MSILLRILLRRLKEKLLDREFTRRRSAAVDCIDYLLEYEDEAEDK